MDILLMKNLKFRQATDSDSEFAYQTKRAAFKEYVEIVWGWDEAEQRRLHERRFSSQDFRVVQVSGQDVGILATVREPDFVKINQLYILPEYQNRGVGEECVIRIIQDAEASKLPVRLQVLRVNTKAQTFWMRLGFKITGETDTHFLMERPL
jgi:ribosomal protein S18 acetylase RimI-like enzyme